MLCTWLHAEPTEPGCRLGVKTFSRFSLSLHFRYWMSTFYAPHDEHSMLLFSDSNKATNWVRLRIHIDSRNLGSIFNVEQTLI